MWGMVLFLQMLMPNIVKHALLRIVLPDIVLDVGDGVVFANVGAFVGSCSICAASFAKVPSGRI